MYGKKEYKQKKRSTNGNSKREICNKNENRLFQS